MDKIVVVSEELKTLASERLELDPNRIAVITPSTVPRVQEARNSSYPTRIVCPATSTYREGLELLIRSISLVKRRFPDVQLFLTKKGDTLFRTMKFARELGVEPIYFYYPQAEDFYAFLASCDIGVVTSSNDVTRMVSYPAKLYDFMSVGIPIVANDVGGWTRIIRDANGGILTSSTPESLASAICEMISDPKRAHQLGQNGLEYLRSNLSAEKRVKQFYDVLVNAASHS
jgi:glycosyltransferase involved in cell wall biosynthesis